MVAEKGDGRFILGMGFKPYGLEALFLYQSFDVAQQAAADAPPLKLRIDPEVGNRLVKMLPRGPTRNRAAEFRHANCKPGRAGEIGKGARRIVVKRRCDAESRGCLPPRPEADGRQNLRFLLIRVANDDQAAPSLAV